MDPFRPKLPDQGPQPVDPRLQPTPDYGNLGPGSDIASNRSATSSSAPKVPEASRISPVIAVAIGVVFALLLGNVSRAHAAWEHIAGLFAFSANPPAISSRKEFGQLDRLKPQKQAETLLELAVSNTDGSVEQIAARVDRWRGKLKWTSQLSALTTAALNSRDMRVRESGIEVQLAAYGLAKNPGNIEFLVQEAESSDHTQRIWALWTLGLMGNRGVETDRVEDVLTGHLKDQDEESRRWAVEGLALVGTARTVGALLQTMHDDPSPGVRERAACSLAESGMLTPDQRRTAVPQLVNYTGDASLDSQTRAWAFQALGDITKQRLPNDPVAWRTWYESNRTEQF
jgi:hypothetical protein